MKFLATLFFFLTGFISSLSSINIQSVGQPALERDLFHKVLDCFTFFEGHFSFEEAVENLHKARRVLADIRKNF